MASERQVHISDEDFGVLISAAFLLAEEDTYITKRLLFIADSWLARKADGE